MNFASREKSIISQWEAGVGMVAGGGPMARLPRLIGRNRALEVLLSSEDIRADPAEAYGYIKSRPARRRSRCVRRGVRDPDRQVRQMGDRQHQASRQHPLMARGFHKPGDIENRLGYYLGQIGR
jgi:enoyl-CoA hydratase/carnithine racemase